MLIVYFIQLLLNFHIFNNCYGFEYMSIIKGGGYSGHVCISKSLGNQVDYRYNKTRAVYLKNCKYIRDCNTRGIKDKDRNNPSVSIDDDFGAGYYKVCIIKCSFERKTIKLSSIQNSKDISFGIEFKSLKYQSKEPIIDNGDELRVHIDNVGSIAHQNLQIKFKNDKMFYKDLTIRENYITIKVSVNDPSYETYQDSNMYLLYGLENCRKSVDLEHITVRKPSTSQKITMKIVALEKDYNLLSKTCKLINQTEKLEKKQNRVLIQRIKDLEKTKRNLELLNIKLEQSDATSKSIKDQLLLINRQLNESKIFVEKMRKKEKMKNNKLTSSLSNIRLKMKVLGNSKLNTALISIISCLLIAAVISCLVLITYYNAKVHRLAGRMVDLKSEIRTISFADTTNTYINPKAYDITESQNIPQLAKYI